MKSQGCQPLLVTAQSHGYVSQHKKLQHKRTGLSVVSQCRRLHLEPTAWQNWGPAVSAAFSNIMRFDLPALETACNPMGIWVKLSMLQIER